MNACFGDRNEVIKGAIPERYHLHAPENQTGVPHTASSGPLLCLHSGRQVCLGQHSLFHIAWFGLWVFHTS